MKRELKLADKICGIVPSSQIAEPIPMKRELKPISEVNMGSWPRFKLQSLSR